MCTILFKDPAPCFLCLDDASEISIVDLDRLDWGIGARQKGVGGGDLSESQKGDPLALGTFAWLGLGRKAERGFSPSLRHLSFSGAGRSKRDINTYDREVPSVLRITISLRRAVPARTRRRENETSASLGRGTSVPISVTGRVLSVWK